MDKFVVSILVVCMLFLVGILFFCIVAIAQTATQPSPIELRMTAVVQCVNTEQFTREQCVILVAGQ